MKKIIGMSLIVLSLFLIGNITVNAETETQNLEEIVADKLETFGGQEGYEDLTETLENIDLSNYSNEDGKVDIYLFHTKTCGYCAMLVGYLAELTEEYGEYFNVVGYETMYTPDNGTLMNEVASELGDSADGVPYMVIGDESFIGYSSSMDSEILSAITEEFAATEKYDVMDELGKEDEESTSSGSSQVVVIMILLNMILTVGCTGYIVYKINNKPVKK